MIQVKLPKLTKNVDNFLNPMGPRPCTKKDSNSPEYLYSPTNYIEWLIQRTWEKLKYLQYDA